MSSIWSAFTGKKPHASAAPPDSGDSAPTTSFISQPDAFDPSTAASVNSFLSPGNFDPSALHPLAGLGSDLTYLTLDDATVSALPGARTALPSRGWSDDLCYGTGTTYLAALGMGGVWGMAEGFRKAAPTVGPRLKLNYVLNGVTRRGPFMGNSAGVLALVYNGVNSFVGHVRGKHDITNGVLSGALAGGVFKSTRGVKPMLVSSILVAGAAGAWGVGSRVLLV
ncbi:Tim17/Tim22/Tim23/Pmp24 family-domain-containing protein [Geopyxis carbonaria]|nr:Tim17/Tim22/Tim23/Pmp24 family-domain-containing protein [Geopyxis carbonaria]